MEDPMAICSMPGWSRNPEDDHAREQSILHQSPGSIPRFADEDVYAQWNGKPDVHGGQLRGIPKWTRLQHTSSSGNHLSSWNEIWWIDSAYRQRSGILHLSLRNLFLPQHWWLQQPEKPEAIGHCTVDHSKREERFSSSLLCQVLWG